MKILIDWFTEPDNKTWCLLKALSACGALTFLGCSIVHVISNKTFDYQSFGIGFAALMAGAGGSLFMKKDTQV